MRRPCTAANLALGKYARVASADHGARVSPQMLPSGHRWPRRSSHGLAGSIRLFNQILEIMTAPITTQSLERLLAWRRWSVTIKGDPAPPVGMLFVGTGGEITPRVAFSAFAGLRASERPQTTRQRVSKAHGRPPLVEFKRVGAEKQGGTLPRQIHSPNTSATTPHNHFAP